jgi:hypothetical protein
LSVINEEKINKQKTNAQVTRGPSVNDAGDTERLEVKILKFNRKTVIVPDQHHGVPLSPYHHRPICVSRGKEGQSVRSQRTAPN